MAEIGEIIQGKYEILKLIGKGGMSKVYLAMDQNLNKQWAVKEIQKNNGRIDSEVMVQSAMAEANMIKKLDHPSLPRIVDIINNPDVIYVVMDYVEGEPLSNILNKYGAQPQNLVINWAIDLCDVLNYLHTQVPPIIYRDMKPANIMIQPNGNIKLIDFGIAREYKEDQLSDTVSLGTKGYAAPEQFGGRGQTDARTDIYCLGATLYHLVTGHNPCEPPYEIYPIRNWNPQLSGGLERILQKCTQLNPDDRYQSCAELLYALEHYEEFDEGYISSLRKKLNKFLLFAGVSFISLIVGTVSMLFRLYINNNDYVSNIKRAEISSNEEEKLSYYFKAVKIKPDEVQAYLGIIDAFKGDSVFTVEEETQLAKYVMENLEQIQQNPEYGSLAFEIGKLYWYYYDYGRTENTDNQITRMKSSIQWFDEACKFGGETSNYYENAMMYRDIGKFNRDITLNVQEASDNGTYLPYWENLVRLVETVNKSEKQQEIVNLEVYRLAENAVELYARKFKTDGVQKEEMQYLFEQIKSGIDATEATTDKTIQMKAEITGRLSDAERVIDSAFANIQEVEN